jgi:hypothetical protein
VVPDEELHKQFNDIALSSTVAPCTRSQLETRSRHYAVCAFRLPNNSLEPTRPAGRLALARC